MNIDEYRQGLSERLAQLITRRHKTQRAAAKAAGIHVDQFRKWVNGEIAVGAEKLYFFALASGVDPSWLICGVESPQALTERGLTPQLDATIMHSVLVSMISATRGNGSVVTYTSPEIFADLALALHDYVAKHPDALDDFSRVMRALVRA
jgi:transcriptional regulator with XRE-family HTH domain